MDDEKARTLLYRTICCTYTDSVRPFSSKRGV